MGLFLNIFCGISSCIKGGLSSKVGMVHACVAVRLESPWFAVRRQIWVSQNSFTLCVWFTICNLPLYFVTSLYAWLYTYLPNSAVKPYIAWLLLFIGGWFYVTCLCNCTFYSTSVSVGSPFEIPWLTFSGLR